MRLNIVTTPKGRLVQSDINKIGNILYYRV